jgi:uncharacterized membrane protein YcaP (DUF421 family)
MDGLLIGDPGALQRTALIGVLAYAVLVLFLRISGRRTLSKMNAFDLVVTVALGSTLATILLDAAVSLAQGALALGLLVLLQFLITWSSVRAGWVRRLATGEPILLLRDGQMLPGAMRRARVTAAELRAAVRAAGIGDLPAAAAVVLETDGSFSVIREPPRVGNALDGVVGPGGETKAVRGE